MRVPDTLDAFLELIERDRDHISDPAVLKKLRASIVAMLEIAHQAQLDASQHFQDNKSIHYTEKLVVDKELDSIVERLSQALEMLDRQHLS
ncbi:MAG: hypothetical protein AAFY22_07135 [Pseudomonadota bacterium]